MERRFGRAIFFIDPLRPHIPSGCPTQKNLKWIYGLFRYGLSVQGVTCEKFQTHISPSFSELQHSLYDGMSYEQSLLKWAQHFEKQCPFEIASREDDLIIGFELSPGIKLQLEKREIPFIDIRVHPSRYLSDLILSFYSNDARLTNLFLVNRRCWEDRPEAIARLSSYYSRLGNLEISKGRVFLAQSRHDSTVITGNSFLDFEQLAPFFENKSEEPLFVLPHPHDLHNPLVINLIEVTGAISLEGENFYSLALMAGDDVEFLTFTSGSGREAEDFGRRVTFLGKHHYGRKSLNEARYTAMSTAIFSPQFWGQAINGLAETVSHKGSGPTLRSSLGEKWSYPF